MINLEFVCWGPVREAIIGVRFFEVPRRTGFDWATVQARVVIASFPRRFLYGKGFVLYLLPWFGFLRDKVEWGENAHAD